MTFFQLYCIASIFFIAISSSPYLLDRLGYYASYDNSLSLFSSSVSTANSLIQSDTLWYLTIRTFKLFLSKYLFFTILSIFNFVFFLNRITKYSQFSLLTIVLSISPDFLFSTIIHLRQGFALAILFLIIGDFEKPKSIIRFVFGSFVALLIHTGSISIPISYTIFYFFRNYVKITQYKFIFIFLLFSPAVFIYISPYFSLIKRYLSSNVGGSGIGFIFWIIIFLLLANFSSRTPVIRDYSLFNLGIYLSCYFFIPGIVRVLEMSLPFIFIAIQSTAYNCRKYFLILWIIYDVFQYILRSQTPLFGFGI